jgi:hypothetical protein
MRLFNHIRRSDQPPLQLDTMPHVREVIVEIGLVLAVHLAFALAVALALNAFGIS